MRHCGYNDVTKLTVNGSGDDMKNNHRIKVGQRIKDRRKLLKMSADELGEKIGKNRATVYRYENGDIENLPIEMLEPIAEALDTTPLYLMGWDSDKEETSKKIDATTDVLIRMETDKLYSELVMLLYKMDTDRLLAVKAMLDSLKLFSSAERK